MADNITEIDKPLNITCVDGINTQSLAINALSAMILAVVTYKLVEVVISTPLFCGGITASIIWVLLVNIRTRLGVTVQSQEAIVYMDNIISRKNIVYLQGFHFTAWYYSIRKAESIVSFLKHHVVASDGKQLIVMKFPASDGTEMTAEIMAQFNFRDDPEALSRSLKFSAGEIMLRVRSVIESRLTDYAAKHTRYELLSKKDEVMEYVSKIFNGDDELSPIELKLGINISSPQLNVLDLSEESKATFRAQAKADMLESNIKKLQASDGANLSSEDANLAALAAQGLISYDVRKYVGIANAKVIALGDAGVAVAAQQQSSKKGK